MNYSFTIVIKPYIRTGGCLEDIRVIYNGSICIVAKNSKFGGLYLHPSAKIIKGNFLSVAGSVRYPILYLKKETHIRVEGSIKPPNIMTDQKKETNSISIIDISSF